MTSLLLILSLLPAVLKVEGRAVIAVLLLRVPCTVGICAFPEVYARQRNVQI